MLSALHWVHDKQRMLHRDLRPSTIGRFADGWRLTSFGLATQVHRPDAAARSKGAPSTSTARLVTLLACVAHNVVRNIACECSPGRVRGAVRPPPRGAAAGAARGALPAGDRGTRHVGDRALDVRAPVASVS